MLIIVNISFAISDPISKEGDSSDGDTYMETGESYYASSLDVVIPEEGDLGYGTIYKLYLFDSDEQEIASSNRSKFWSTYTANRDDVEYVAVTFKLSVPVNMPICFDQNDGDVMGLEPDSSMSYDVTISSTSTTSYYSTLSGSWSETLSSSIVAEFLSFSASLAKSITGTIGIELGWESSETESYSYSHTYIENNNTSSIIYYRGERRGTYDAYITAEYELTKTSTKSLYDRYELIDTFYDYSLQDDCTKDTSFNRYYYSSKKSEYLLYDYADTRTDQYFFDA